MTELHIPLLSKRLLAAESLAAGDLVYIDQSQVLDDFNNYTDITELQSTWVDSDAINKMISRGDSGQNPSANRETALFAVNPNNTGDYAQKTITSKNLTGYTIHILAKASATSGDWEFLLASGANAATDNVKKALVFADTNTMEHLSFTVAGMTADNGSYNIAATVRAAFRCVDDTGDPELEVTKIWYEKAGTTYIGMKGCIGGAGGSNSWGANGVQAIGIVNEALSAGEEGVVTLLGPVVGGYTGLIAGFVYFPKIGVAGGLTPYYEEALEDISQSSGSFYTGIGYGIAISETELMLTTVSYGRYVAP